MPGARRFAVDGLSDLDRTDLADVAELVVSELAGNAALHSGAEFMYVTVALQDPGVRVAVEDDGPVGIEVVSPHVFSFEAVPIADDGLDAWDDQPTTGRGLAIVSMVAAEWGVESTGRGKVVWADLVDPDAVQDVRSPVHPETAEEPLSAPGLPPGWVLVRLAGCPVELSLKQDQHLDELVRELQLLAADRDNSASQAIAADIERLLDSPAHARLTGRRAAQRALADGLEVVDVEMAMPPEFSTVVRELNDAVTRADELCDANELLALASTPEIRQLRAWMTHEIIAQIEHDHTPTSWSRWTARAADPSVRNSPT